MVTSGMVIVGSYDYHLVILSILIAILASYTALDLAGRVTASRGGARLFWLIGGAVSMGIGIWSMHYIGMAAFTLPVPVRYDWPTVLLSLLAGIFYSAVALLVVSRRKMGTRSALAGSLCMGGGIVTLHYTAMAAMRMPAMCRYSAALVALSVVFAVAGSLLSLWLAFFFRNEPGGRWLRKVGSALLMGAAIAGMHYTAMAAAGFSRSSMLPDLSHAIGISFLGSAGLGSVSAMVLGLTLLTSMVDRLQKQRTLLDELFEHAPQAVALTNADHRVLRVNREFSRVFGYKPQEALGRHLSELVVPDEWQEEAKKYWDLVARGQRVDAEGVRRRKDGSRLYVALVMVPFRVPGAETAVYAIYRDITQHKQAEDALRASEEQFRAAFENSAIGMAITNLEGCFVRVNRAFCDITGYSEAELRPLNWLSITYPDDRERNLDLRKRMLAGELPHFVVETRYITKRSDTVWVRNSTSLLRDSSGTPTNVIALVEDITERKRVEEELQASFDQLRALAARLQSVREEEGTRVAREIHDQLGQALTAIKIDLASLAAELPAVQKKLESILKLVDETIQSVRRISTQLRPGILDDLGLVAAVEWAAEEFEARTGIKCWLDLPEDSVAIDPECATAIFRIFQETLTNVARHANATEVHVRLAKENGNLVLEVRDNGSGISEAQVSTSRSLGILGMRERALLLGGEFTISGAPGRGTTMKVQIPETRANSPGSASD